MKARFSLCAALATLALAGCAGLETSAPVVPLKADLQRSDFVIVGPVKGHARTTYILAGLFQIVDGEFTLLGWQIFNDSGEMTLGNPADSYAFDAASLPFITNPDFSSVHSRAMYRAYSRAPEADALYSWSFLRNAVGVPLIWRSVDVTARACALRIKPDLPGITPGVIPSQEATVLPVTPIAETAPQQ